MKKIYLMIALLWAVESLGQTQTYQNKKGDTHLCGPMQLADLEAAPYNEWFQENYTDFSIDQKKYKWIKNLKNTQVDIYLGTWCGDSKQWVPAFVKLWDQLGLDRSQLNFVALYDGSDQYKQGPNGEEKGKNIHRVPTFIFQEDGKEVARIVESPRNDFLTDVAQIALGYPSEPNYRAAAYVQQLVDTRTPDEIHNELKKHVWAAWDRVGRSNELNTLGYVYLHAGEIEKAKIAFEFNTYLFRNEPNVYDSYAEAFLESGDKEQALALYQKVLELDAENENAKKQIEILKNGKP